MKKGLNAVDILIHVFLMILLIITFVPFYNVVIVSLASPAEIAKQGYYLIPKSFDLSSYKMIMEYCRIDIAFANSILVTVVGTFFSIIITSCAAYALAKNQMPGRKFIMSAIIFTMLFNGGLVPFYLTIKNLHLINNRLVMILPILMNTFYLIIMINYFKTIPASIEESAKIDGANDIIILFKIVIPVSLPTFIAIILFYSVDKWNEWWYSLLFISDTSKYPMQLFLKKMLTEYTRLVRDSYGASYSTTDLFPDGLKMATIVITVIPIMVVYPFIQKYFASGVMLGAVKE